jgi:hypothetical protein
VVECTPNRNREVQLRPHRPPGQPYSITNKKLMQVTAAERTYELNEFR